MFALCRSLSATLLGVAVALTSIQNPAATQINSITLTDVSIYAGSGEGGSGSRCAVHPGDREPGGLQQYCR